MRRGWNIANWRGLLPLGRSPEPPVIAPTFGLNKRDLSINALTCGSAVAAARLEILGKWPGWAAADRDLALREYRQVLQAVVDAVCPDVEFEFSLRPRQEGPPGRGDEVCVVSISKNKLSVETNEPFFQANQYHFSLGLRLVVVLLILPLVAREIGDRDIVFALSVGDDSTGMDVGFCARDDCVLIPDPEFLFTTGYLDFRAGVLAHWIPWSKRQPRVFWRGSTTGLPQRTEYSSSGPEWYKVLPRTEMCMRLRTAPYNAFCDVAVANVVQLHDPVLVERIEKELKGDFVDRWTQMQWGFLIDIDGNTNSWPGLMQSLIMGACVIKVASPYKQWYYGELKPETNIISVKADLSDLEEKLVGAVQRPKRAEQIAANGHALAGSITFENSIAAAAENLLDRFG